METKHYATKNLKGHLRNQRRNFKNYLETNENGNTMIQTLWIMQQMCSNEKVCNDTSLPQKQEKTVKHTTKPYT